MDATAFRDVIARRFPYDGPHTAEGVIDAADGLPEVVRYLNNATRATRGPVGYAAAVHDVLGSVTAALYGLGQLLDQLAAALARQAAEPAAGLYDDRPERAPLVTAGRACDALGAARAQLGLFVRHLVEARNFTTHLGNDIGEGRRS